MAARATTLGGVARGTVQAVTEHSALPPVPPDERDQTRLVEELAHRVDCVVAELSRRVVVG